MNGFTRTTTTLALLALAGAAQAVPLTVVNHSFENDPNSNAEFFFGDPDGWTLYDPGNIVDLPNGPDIHGTLEVTGSAYFGGVAPDGDNVAILFIGGDTGTSEFGIQQTLGDTLQANTHYSLTVDVGNIESGPTQQFGFFDLSGFPGYRVQLLAGGNVLAEVADGIAAPIGEGEFAPVTLDFITGAAHANLGEALGIRLINRNLDDPAFPDPDVDLEVDFDNVRLDATTVGVPEPATAMLLAGLLVPLTAGRIARR